MANVVHVEEQFIGAGQLYCDDVLIGGTREDNVWRIVENIAAPVLNGAGGMVRRTDYHVQRPYAELECTMTELTPANLALIVPGSSAAAGSGDDAGKTIITGPTNSQRRLGTSDYHKWVLRVPGTDAAEVEFRILIGIATSNAEFTAADSEIPIGPRLTIQERLDEDDTDVSQWEVALTEATGS